ncbi:segregation and condensation protein A [Tichowtungia aerotolerans]|uniref:Segregation and condensation protein A n=1 Tax=Tichowtungia aerotolerans TaxID=2697043 RepID=A0A6P1MDA8_9BACT|nr:segregation/condensation protein A [Tichowtungia aerotolerans]QHI69576.1 segregation/condensation protein A [Tichowtungia aerotolerans]
MAELLPDEEYKVNLEVFEGPLDLLLYLIKKDEVDIYDIPIGRITAQYMEYLELMKILNLEIAGDFIVMASTLMLIKSRMLLPDDDRGPMEEDDEDDPRWDLVRQLVEYKKFKDAAGFLEVLEEEQENVFGREGEHVELGSRPDVGMQDVGIFDLISALNEALDRVPSEELQEIFAEQYTVGEKVDDLLSRTSNGQKISLGRLFIGMRSRQEIVCTFLAVLELIKLNRLAARQDSHFEEIVIEQVDESDVPAALEEDPEEESVFKEDEELL